MKFTIVKMISIIRFNDKKFGDKIRAFVDYNTYFNKKDLVELSRSKNYFKHITIYQKN